MFLADVFFAKHDFLPKNGPVPIPGANQDGNNIVVLLISPVSHLPGIPPHCGSLVRG